MNELTLDGIFYSRFVKCNHSYSEDDKKIIEKTVCQLITQETTVSKPGMLLGKIQSGKTKIYVGCIALAFDNFFDLTLVLTKGTKALALQTYERITKEFSIFTEEDKLQVYDILNLPPNLTAYEMKQKLVFVIKKQIDNFSHLKKIIFEIYPGLSQKKILLIDDEADYASIGFKRKKSEGLMINKIGDEIDQLRKRLNKVSFLQVTATPYSLYLQPEDLKIKESQKAFKPVRPAFTELVPVHKDYIGGDYYFSESQEENSEAFYLHNNVSVEELCILKKEDRRTFKIEHCLTSSKIKSLRNAIINFIVGGTIRNIQNTKTNKADSKYSFIMHTESQKNSHEWQEKIVTSLKNKLEEINIHDSEFLKKLILTSYDNLKGSIKIRNHYLPSFDEVFTSVSNALSEGQVMITKVNSEQQVMLLLNEKGELKLRTPLNIFIGGQILDRGITIANLIGFFYGRSPNKFQQDTVLQHSRMYGFRPLEDLAVTRFYTSNDIYDAMYKIHEIDSALRNSIMNGNKEVIFIRKDESGGVIPCSPNKILLSTTTTLKPFKRLLPTGFQTGSKTEIISIITSIDEKIDTLSANKIEEPFLISLDIARDFIQKIAKTFKFENGYNWDVKAFLSSIEYLSSEHTNENLKNKVWCLVRKGRNISRFVTKGHSEFSSSPDTSSNEGELARKTAIDIPVLMLIRQNGLEEQGWKGSPFYWPILIAPKNTKTVLFASDIDS